MIPTNNGDTLARIADLVSAFEWLEAPHATITAIEDRRHIRIQRDADAEVIAMAAAIGAPDPVRRSRDGFEWLSTEVDHGKLRVTVSGPHVPIRTEAHEVSDEIARLTGGGR